RRLRVYVLRRRGPARPRRPVPDRGGRGAGLHFPGLDCGEILRRPAVRARGPRGVARAEPLPRGGAAAVRRGGAAGGGRVMPCRILDWDSEFFRRRIATFTGKPADRATFERAIEWCRAERVACVYLRSDVEDLASRRLAEDHGFRLVDLRVTYA